MPFFACLTHRDNVEFPIDNLRHTSGWLNPTSITILIASSLNSFVNTARGILCIVTPPFGILLQLRCPLNPSYVKQGTNTKELHAKIGQLAMENDFLAGALGRIGDPSAKK